MRTNVGLWIDRRRAIIVAVTDQGENTRLIVSKAERQLHCFGDLPLEGADDKAQGPARESRQRMLKAHLNIYYGAVIASIRQAESVLIFGSGQAKRELSNRLKRANLSGRIVGMETVDKMTNHQIAAKVRQHCQDKGDQPLKPSGRTSTTP
ncbi:MAG: hypothetical protein M1376_21910 [Planctomycetes bacterium]|nr:hypothetical protein [Planctomycetota bacterium]